MAKKKTSNKKKSYAYEIVAADILSRILNGEWVVGERIDTIDKLGEHYPHNRMTIFKALQLLASQKYLRMRRGSGVYVTRNTPIIKIGIIVSEYLLHHQSRPFYYLLFKAAEDVFAAKGIELNLYLEKKSPDPTRWIPLPDLEAALHDKSLAGILTIGCCAPISLMKTQLWQNNSVPHVTLTSHKNTGFSVITDNDNMFEQVFTYCCRERYKTLAVISPGLSLAKFKNMQELAQSKNVAIKDEWIPGSHLGEDNPELEGYDNMMALWQRENKPEAVFVTDDVVCKGVTLAILRLGIKFPDELLIISAANKNSNIFYPVPVVKFEFDAYEIIKQAEKMLLDLISDPQCRKKTSKIQPVLNLDSFKPLA